MFTVNDSAPATYMHTDGMEYPHYPDYSRPMVKGQDYCPGFNLWLVERADGFRFVMDADDESGARTRLFFRTNGLLGERSSGLCEDITLTKIGPNPAVEEWNALWD